MEKVKNNFLLDIAKSIKKGKNPAQICKDLNISKQRLNYWLSLGKKQGLFKKIGYGVWEIDTLQEVKISSKDTIPQPQLKEVRGHAFIWKVQVPRHLKNVDWRALFQAKGIDFKEIGLKNTPRVFIENRKVWFGKKNIVIYEPGSFFAVNSIESRKLAVFKLLDLLKKIEQKIGLILSPYKFTPRREHFALVKNSLAIQCNKDGTKIYIKDNGGLWFVIDNSYNLDEAETMGQDALKTNLGAQKYFNEHKKTNFAVTPLFVLESFNKVNQNAMQTNQNLESYAVHLKAHVESVQKLGDAVEKLVQKVDELGKAKGI